MTSLEAFENVEDAVSSLGDFVREGIAHYSKEDIKKAYEGLHLIENKLKVLELIKKKIYIGLGTYCIGFRTYKENYYLIVGQNTSVPLTKEEFDLIKGCLERK